MKIKPSSKKPQTITKVCGVHPSSWKKHVTKQSKTPKTDALVEELQKLKINTLQYPCETRLLQLARELETELTEIKEKQKPINCIIASKDGKLKYGYYHK